MPVPPPRRPLPVSPRTLPVRTAPLRPMIEIGPNGEIKPSNQVRPGVVLTPRGLPVAPAPYSPAPSPVEIKPYDLVPSVVLAPTLGGRARAEAIVAEIKRLRRANVATGYRLGVLLNELSTSEMVGNLGCASFKDVLAAHELGSYPSAIRYMTVAAEFTEEEVMEIGTEKGLALVSYVKATGAKSPPAMILRSGVKLAGLVVRDHTVVTLRTAIHTAVTRLRERADAEDDTVQETDRVVRKLGPKLRQNGAKTVVLKRVKRGSRVFIRVEIDPDEALELCARLDAARR